MSTEPLSGWRKLARARFPQARIEGDGPIALIPCNPSAKVYLFFTKESALAVRDHWPCSVMCFGNHKAIDIRPAPPPRQSNSTYRSPSAGTREKD
jgi:hypothetical protein